MSWYCAHIVMFVEFKHRRQQKYPVWENIVVISARTHDEAFTKAESHGRAAEGDDDGSFRWQSRPARWVFAGVRKLTECQDAAQRPSDGTEITYNEFELKTRDALQEFCRGESVDIRVCDQFAIDESVEADTIANRRNKRTA